MKLAPTCTYRLLANPVSECAALLSTCGRKTGRRVVARGSVTCTLCEATERAAGGKEGVQMSHVDAGR
jgi:hypothetical protein